MIKHKETFINFLGKEDEEEVAFHLNKAEIAELEITHKGGLKAYLEYIAKTDNGTAVMDTFKTILGMGIGVKSPDGKRFMKSEEIKQDFFNGCVYPKLFIKLCTDAKFASDFINGMCVEIKKC